MQRPTLPPAVSPPTLPALADQLRAGPLQLLRELQAQLAELTDCVEEGSTSRVEDIERLVQLSVSAMAHFNAFTRELTGALRELTDAHRNPH
jgi:hypothetical protein